MENKVTTTRFAVDLPTDELFEYVLGAGCAFAYLGYDETENPLPDSPILSIAVTGPLANVLDAVENLTGCYLHDVVVDANGIVNLPTEW